MKIQQPKKLEEIGKAEAKPIPMSIESRLFLMRALESKGRGMRADELRRLSGALKKKIAIPADELGIYEVQLPMGGARHNLEAMKAAEMVEISLTPAEARRALKVINEWDNFGPEDDDWLDDLVESLESISKG